MPLQNVLCVCLIVEYLIQICSSLIFFLIAQVFRQNSMQNSTGVTEITMQLGVRKGFPKEASISSMEIKTCKTLNSHADELLQFHFPQCLSSY